MVRCRLKIITLLILFNLFLILPIPIACAQEEVEYPAEIVATIENSNNKIPPIKISEWTTINLTVEDVFGVNWTRLKEIFPIQSVYIWPIIHPNWKPFLGYTSVRFEPEIIQGDPRGWYAKISPSSISEADQGRTYNLKLEVLTDDIAVDYAVVLGIKTSRLDVNGEVIGISYINIPLKASSLNNIKMETEVKPKYSGLHSIVHFDIDIKNDGYYRDMFKLNFTEENGLNALSSTQLLVLDTGESQKVRINILTPDKFWDQGTPNKIKIYASSASDPTPIHLGTVVVVTRGVYISPLIGIILVPIILLIIIICLIFFYLRQKRNQELYGKPPVKPWTLLDKKQHLKELIKKDEEKYSEEMKKLKDEYSLALKSYKQSIVENKLEKKKSKQKIIFKKEKVEQKKNKKAKTINNKKTERKKEYKLTSLFKKSEKKKKTKKIKTKEQSVPEKTKEIPNDKEKLISQIKKEQSKQKRMNK